MRRILESERIKGIEQKWKAPIKDLLYFWHWNDNLKHGEIAKRIGVPRPTVTKWFCNLSVPTQSCTRFTNLNLLNVGLHKGPRAEPRVKRERLPFADIRVFKEWTDEMAYILGYFIADGCMSINPRGAHFIEFTSTDRELIEIVKVTLKSRHRIGEYESKKENYKKRYRLQIGSKEMFDDLLKLGLTPRKSKTIKLPEVPKRYFSHFVRGYFDGDGGVVFASYPRKDRKNLTHSFHAIFTSGSRLFLEALHKKLKLYAKVQGGSLIDKKDGAFGLSFSTNDSRKLFYFFYKGVSRGYFLSRKYNKFQDALKVVGA